MPAMTIRDIADTLGVTTRTVYRRLERGDSEVLGMLDGHSEASGGILGALRAELEEKNRQIAELHQLLAAQQQLALGPGRPGFIRRVWAKIF